MIANASIGFWQRGMFLVEGGQTIGPKWADALGGNTVNGAATPRQCRRL